MKTQSWFIAVKNKLGERIVENHEKIFEISEHA